MDIRKTSNDPIAKILRKMFKDEKIKEKYPVVCSFEKPIKIESKTISSNSFVPATSGLLITSYIINDIIDKEVIYEKK
jgi:tRNA A37 threonylcarbamoyladenosine dehydratase